MPTNLKCMKKVITIKFSIYQDDLERQKPEPVLIIDTVPNNEDIITQEELEKTRTSIIRISDSNIEKKDMPEHFGQTYLCKIKGKAIKDIIKELKI